MRKPRADLFVGRIIVFRDKLAMVGRRHRKWVLLAALLFFLAATVFSLLSLDLRWADLSWPWLLLSLVVSLPAVILNANELQLLARAGGRRLTLLSAVEVTSLGTLANVLPMPGALLLRAKALSGAGVSTGRVSVVLLAGSMLWIGVSAGVISLLFAGHQAAVPLAVFAMVATAGSLVFLQRGGGTGGALGAVLVRLSMTLLAGGRTWLCMAMLGFEADFLLALGYSACSVLGAVVGVVPGGLGVAEGAGALLALMLREQPALAVLALGASRVVGLFAAGLAFGAAQAVRRKMSTEVTDESLV